jgi:molybdopterin-guanine dinucleotide biosynthesis protein A
MDAVPVYILAGGKSSRFGRDKARATVAGKALIVQLAEAVGPVASSVTAVAEVADKYADLEIRTIPDMRPGLGPLGGLHAALADVGDDAWLLLLSCDFVGVKAEWIRRLMDSVRPDAQIVLFRDVRWEPLLALYHTSVKAVVDEHIEREQRPMWALVEAVEHVVLPAPAEWAELSNVNTPGDLTEIANDGEAD